MSPFSLPRSSKKSKPLQSQPETPSLVIDVNTSKIQHLLGISQAELASARSYSLSSSSTSRLPTSSLSEATTVPVTNDGLTTVPPTSELRLKASSALLGDESEGRLTATSVSGSQLSRYPSSSTLHSHYDPSKAPLSVSQQTSASSSRDFALRKGTPSIIAGTIQEMEHARQMLLFKTSKSGARDGRKLNKLLTKRVDHNTQSPPVTHPVSQDIASDQHMLFSSSVSLPATPQPPVTPVKKFFSTLKRAESQYMRTPPAKPTVTHDPYAKINVRRPKAGAKHWFDGIEGESSDEDDHNEPELTPNFVVEVQRAFGGMEPEISCSRRNGSQDTITQSNPTDLRTPRSCAPSRVTSATSKPSETPASQSTLSRRVSFRHDQIRTDERSLGSKVSRTKLKAFAGVDLNKQSVLSLSSSDDEDEDESAPRTPPQTLLPAPRIRESLAGENVDESDIEVGLAQTIKVQAMDLLPRGAHTSTMPSLSSQSLAPPIHVPPRASSRNASYILDQSSENDASESDIITSFPATPSDTASFGTSIRSSILSDSGSLASIRPMMVTKQEEKLLAAMRLKRVAMRQSSKESDRSSALRILESGGRGPTTSNGHSRPRLSEQTRLDMRLSNRYTPSRFHLHQRSLSSDHTGKLPDPIRASGTTFDTSTTFARDSSATIRTMFSDDQPAPYRPYSSSEVTATSPSERQSQMSAFQRRELGRRDTYFSVASDESSHHRDSHVVMLDGLDEALTRESIPSQLFMEAPFIGWERAGLTAAH